MINKEFYAYLDIRNPIVAWEVAIGRVVSSNFNLNTKIELGTSFWQYNLLKNYADKGLTNNIKNEFELEYIRQKFFPQKVSRLTGMYFFESEEDVMKALERWDMLHKKEYISKVLFSAENLTKVDSEWITNNLLSNVNDNEWMSEYWNGKVLGSKPLYEILATGIGTIQNNKLREKAYELIRKNHPYSTPLLSMACCGFASGIETIALSRPFLIVEDNVLKGSYSLYIQDLENKKDEIIVAMEKCKKNKSVPPMIKHPDPKIFFKLPDLSNMSFVLKEHKVTELFSKIHTYNDKLN